MDEDKEQIQKVFAMFNFVWQYIPLLAQWYWERQPEFEWIKYLKSSHSDILFSILFYYPILPGAWNLYMILPQTAFSEQSLNVG